MQIRKLDHLVLTVRNLDVTTRFYVDVMRMRDVRFDHDRRALAFGDQKINLHLAGSEVKPNATHAEPGSDDLCFLTNTPMAEVVAHLESLDIPIELGPVPRTGAMGSILSVYFRDPDGNLIEVSNQVEG